MSQILIYIMIFFSLLGGLDKIIGNKLGLGSHFEKGFNSMGSLSLSMLGLYTIAPLIGKLLLPILSPINKSAGIDPSIFIGALLAPDMGGYNTAVLISINEKIGLFSGIILSSLMGATFAFTVPIATGIISKKDYVFFSKGILYGLVTVPIGSFLAGIMMGIPIDLLLINHLPIVLFSTLIAIGLYKIPKNMFKWFNTFGRVIVSISIIGLLLSILDFTLNIKVIEGLVPLEEGIIIVGQIAIILSGAYPIIHLISTKIKKPLLKLGKHLDINDSSVLGLITLLANSIPMLMLYRDMDSKGKVLNSAFAVSATFTFGGQLGFVSSVANHLILPFVLSKLIAGVAALSLAYFMSRKAIAEFSTI